MLHSIQTQLDKISEATIHFRRQLHKIPEIGGDLPKTRKAILNQLQDTGLTIQPPLIGSDIVAELNVGANRTLAFRADMDALPLDEKTGLPYASCHTGAMHACGHDGHSAMLTGTARLLSNLKDRLKVNIRFIFQPGEELIALGKNLVQAGACRGCDTAYAFHGMPGYPAGAIVCRTGTMYAASGGITIKVIGKGCHGAKPQNGVNPLDAGSAVVQRLLELHKRFQASDKSVVTPTLFQAGYARNIIPDTAEVGGTFRYFKEETGTAIQNAIRSIADSVEKEKGVHIETSLPVRYAVPVVNTEGNVRAIQTLAAQYLGSEYYIKMAEPTTGAEDFAYYLKGRRGALMGLGMGEDHPVIHSSQFDFNDRAIRNGILMFSLLAFEEGPG